MKKEKIKKECKTEGCKKDVISKRLCRNCYNKAIYKNKKEKPFKLKIKKEKEVIIKKTDIEKSQERIDNNIEDIKRIISFIKEKKRIDIEDILTLMYTGELVYPNNNYDIKELYTKFKELIQ